VAGTALAGCGSGGGSGSADCGPPRREALDPSSAQHVLGDGDGTATYQTDPPTSGPHAPGRALSGVLDEPLSRPAQVGVLEAGGILVQYRDLTDEELDELSTVAGDGVAVVPNADLPDRVVATAWLFKQTCSDVDVAALGRFVEDHAGPGPGTDG
jgi:hypothetical protein